MPIPAGTHKARSDADSVYARCAGRTSGSRPAEFVAGRADLIQVNAKESLLWQS
jgi:hypothetical protein